MSNLGIVNGDFEHFVVKGSRHHRTDRVVAIAPHSVETTVSSPWLNRGQEPSTGLYALPRAQVFQEQLDAAGQAHRDEETDKLCAHLSRIGTANACENRGLLPRAAPVDVNPIL